MCDGSYLMVVGRECSKTLMRLVYANDLLTVDVC